jgi:hypothetical protein
VINHLLVRRDCSGYYFVTGGEVKPGTAKRPLRNAHIWAHFRARETRDVIGLHTTRRDPDGISRSIWLCADVDHHGEGEPPEANRRAALAWHGVLATLGFRPLLIDSNGRGGYRLYVIFDEPIPTADVRRLGRWLIRDWREQGLAEEPEVFPKQDEIAPPGSGGGSFGNWVRLPGRHHRRDHWSSVWDGQAWVEGDRAIDILVSTTGDRCGLIPDEAFEPAPDPRRPRGDRGSETMPDEEIEENARPAKATRANANEPYGRAALKDEVDQLAAKGPGQRHDFLRDSCLRLASLVKGGHLTESAVLDGLRDGARANGLEAEGRGAEVDELWAGAMKIAETRIVQERSPNPSPNGDRRARRRKARGGGAASSGGAGQGPERESQAKILLRLCKHVQLFHTVEKTVYAKVRVGDHHETHEVRSTAFRRWLVGQYFAECEAPPSSEALQRALAVLEAKAVYEGPLATVHVRVGGSGDTIFIDLGDERWRMVEITPAGWRVISHGDAVRFIRPAGLRALPEPRRGGSLKLLQDLVNVTDEESPLLVAWLMAALRPDGPYPILALFGEQGSAKSTLAKLAKALVDPHVAPLRSPPANDRDLAIAAGNSWLVAYNNVSSISPWLSDALCGLATEGGYATRTLYTDKEETYFNAKRPITLNGIEDYATRGDLVDRCVFLHLPTIPEDKRRTEEDYWRAAAAAAPLILGALFDAVAAALKALPDIRLTTLPRMADFARWGEAVGLALGWEPGKFLEAYNANRKDAIETVLEDSPVTGAVRRLLDPKPSWEGTASDLLAKLTEIVGEKVAESKRWPHSARGMSGAVKRLAPALRAVGIDVEFGQRTKQGRPITIHQAPQPEKEGKGPSPSSPPSPDSASAGVDTGLGGDGRGDGSTTRPSPGSRPSPDRHHDNSVDRSDLRRVSDGGDGRIPPLSGGRAREVF